MHGRNGPKFGMQVYHEHLQRFWSQSDDFPTFDAFYPMPVWPSGIVIACICVVRPCVNHLLVSVITRDLFKLGSPNLDHRCKRPWLRSLSFWGVIDLCLQGQINLQSQNLPHFELVRMITHHPFKPGPLNLEQGAKYLG